MDILKSGQAVLSLLKIYIYIYIYIYTSGKNNFFEMKGDGGMSSHEKEREQEDAFTQTQTLINNPIPTSLFCFKILFVCCECIRQRNKIFTSNWPHEIHCGLERNKGVGLGL